MAFEVEGDASAIGKAGTIGRYVRALAVSPWISTICGFVEGMESDGSCFFM